MWSNQGYGKVDSESAEEPVYTLMLLETSELQWSFIRKVYAIIATQLLAIVAVGAVVVTVKPISVFFGTTDAGIALYVILICVPLITLWLLYIYRQKQPENYILLSIFSLSLAVVVGLSCAFTSEKVILEASILTAVVLIGLTLYTFWAASRGYDFKFLGPFLFGAVLVLLAFLFIQILFPLGKLSEMIYGCLASIVICGYILYDTEKLLKRYYYDQYIWASVSLYLDIFDPLLFLLSKCGATEK